MPKTLDVITIGSTMRDLMFYTPEGKVFFDSQNAVDPEWLAFPLAGKVNIPKVYFTWGGGAANTAVALAKLGLKIGVVSAIGKDYEGQQAVANLKKYQIDTSLEQKVGKTNTGLSIIISRQSQDKEHIAFANRGANCFLKFKVPNKKLKGVKYFYLNAVGDRNWPKILDQVFSAAKKFDIKMYWNPGNLQLQGNLGSLKKFLKQTEVLQVNEEEARQLAARFVKDVKKLKRINYVIKYVKRLGPKVVIITQGQKGAKVLVGKKTVSHKIYPSKNVDTIGVGDSFGAAFLASLIYYPGEIKRALRWGMINSAANVAAVGAQIGVLNKAELEKRNGEWKA